MNEEEFIELIQKPEGPTLDFKRQQYKLVIEQNKSEFIKDILSMANTIRDCTSYIVIGIKAYPDGRKELVGESCHWDDANLQLVIKDKVEKVPPFHYFPITIHDKTYGIIEIPVSYDKPFRVSRDFGVIKKHAVYLRRGTMNDEARDDEIRAMYLETPSAENAFIPDTVDQQGTSNGKLSNPVSPFNIEELKLKTGMPNYVRWEAVFTNNSFKGYEVSEMYPKYSKCFLKARTYPVRFFPIVLSPTFRTKNYPDVVFESPDYAGIYSNVFQYDKMIFKDNEVIYSFIELNNSTLAQTNLPSLSLIYLIFFLKNLHEQERVPTNIDFSLKIIASDKTYYCQQTALFNAEATFESYFLKGKECEINMNLTSLDINETCRMFQKIYSLFVSDHSRSINPFLTLDKKDFEHVYRKIDSGQFE